MSKKLSKLLSMLLALALVLSLFPAALADGDTPITPAIENVMWAHNTWSWTTGAIDFSNTVNVKMPQVYGADIYYDVFTSEQNDLTAQAIVETDRKAAWINNSNFAGQNAVK